MKRLYFIFVVLVLFLSACTTVSSDVVELNIKGQIKIEVGESLILSVDNNDVLWESMNENIVTISDFGLIYGVAKGTTFIRVSLLNNAAIYDQVAIEVKDKTTTTEPKPDTIDIKLGIDLIDDYLDIFEGKRVGLITNPTGINSNYVSSVDVLFEKVNLVALYAPEHGIRGNLQAGSYIASSIDEKTGLPVYSLYGSSRRPTAEMLANIDILCIDLQDVGARFYTYIYTMAYAMEEAVKYDIEFVVFDRPNPISGSEFEGNILNLDYKSFIGYYPIIQRHGMTIGELAYLFNEEYNINIDLHIIKMEGWKRDYYYDNFDLPWVLPSPNMPSLETAIVYPGTCIFEGTNVSEGRGTTIPFQVIGAPYIDALSYASALNALKLPGVVFRPTYFTPTFSKHKDQLCAGVQVHVVNRQAFKAVKTGWAMLDVLRKMYPNDFQIDNINSPTSMLNLNTGANYISKNLYTLSQQFSILEDDTTTFNTIRMKYLLYN